MRALFIGFLFASALHGQVIEQDVNCHQGLIDLTIVDTSNTPGIYHLYTSDMILIQGAYVEFQPDTFYITFSGIGGEMHTYDSMYVEFQDSILISFNVGCGGLIIEPKPVEDPVIKIEYFSLSGQPLIEPSDLYIELKTYTDRQTWRKIYKN